MSVERIRLLALSAGLAVFAAVVAPAVSRADPAASAALGAAEPEEAAAEGISAEPRPRSRASRSREPEPDELRCTADRGACIGLASYIADVCGVIEAAAVDNALDPHFLARLIWKESLFDAGAVSPAGALGIAQFMPDTARLRGLADPFNPAEALVASARYLAELASAYGNIGLAAVAYNGGEARAERFIARQGGLPRETIAYVRAITGHSAEAWRDAPPDVVDLSLAGEEAFAPACITLASNRSLREFRTAPPVLPWGVIIASNRELSGAERQVGRLRNRHAAVMGGENVAYTHGRTAGMPRPLYLAQIGRDSRSAANALCDRLRATGGDCMVLRN